MVTAEGKLITASASDNPDLFWALRGGGGNFGVVTSFEFQLHQVGPQILFGPTVYRLEDAADVLRNYREFATQAPRECCVWVDHLSAPPLPFLAPRYHGAKVISLMQCYAGDVAEGERILAPVRDYGEPIGDAVAPIPYAAAQAMLDPMYRKGARNYWKSHNFSDLNDRALDVLVAMAGSLPTPQSDVLISQVGGAIDGVAPDATAYPHRATAFIVTPGARWEDPAQDAPCIAWVRRAFEALAEHASGGSYVNFVTEAEGRERDAYGANYDRLVEVKNRYDPTNLFRLNQNVRPTGDRHRGSVIPREVRASPYRLPDRSFQTIDLARTRARPTNLPVHKRAHGRVRWRRWAVRWGEARP